MTLNESALAKRNPTFPIKSHLIPKFDFVVPRNANSVRNRPSLDPSNLFLNDFYPQSFLDNMATAHKRRGPPAATIEVHHFQPSNPGTRIHLNGTIDSSDNENVRVSKNSSRTSSINRNSVKLPSIKNSPKSNLGKISGRCLPHSTKNTINYSYCEEEEEYDEENPLVYKRIEPAIMKERTPILRPRRSSLNNKTFNAPELTFDEKMQPPSEGFNMRPPTGNRNRKPLRAFPYNGRIEKRVEEIQYTVFMKKYHEEEKAEVEKEEEEYSQEYEEEETEAICESTVIKNYQEETEEQEEGNGRERNKSSTAASRANMTKESSHLTLTSAYNSNPSLLDHRIANWDEEEDSEKIIKEVVSKHVENAYKNIRIIKDNFHRKSKTYLFHIEKGC